MAEFNPYKLEEEKWTPKNVYEILPPNAVSWSDYDFGQGTDNVNREAASKSFIDGFVDFFGELFGTAGKILGGAIELGGAVLAGFVDGVVNLIGGIANAIGSVFGGGMSESPDLPLFNPIKTNLEAVIQPHRDKINESWQKTEEVIAEQEVLRAQMAVNLESMRDASARAQEATDRAGTAIAEAEAASAAATEARETLESYNTALNERITTEFNAAVGRADTAVEKADTLAGELADFKTQAATDVENALSKAQAASDELAVLAPQVDEAINNSSAAVVRADQTLEEYTTWAAAQKIRIDSAVSEAEAATANVAALSPQVADAVAKSAAATDNVATLTPQVSDAVSKAGAAVDKADQTLSEYTAWSKAQKTRIDSAVSKAEAAAANVATLSPQVADAVAKSEQSAKDVESLTSDVEATQATADKALADLKNLSVGGRNLLQRLRFTGATSYQKVEDTGEVFWTGEPIYKGTKLTTGSPPTSISRPVTFEPGDEYTVSVWVKGEELVSNPMSVRLRLYSSPLTYASSGASGDGTRWERISATWKNDTSEPISMALYLYLNHAPGEITYITSPQVERGNVVTDWTPPIEDFTAEFSDIREDLNRKYTEALSEAKVAVNALPGINDQIAEIGEKAEQGIADAKAVNDKLPSITQQVTDLATGQGDLAEGLSKAATQEDYNALNTAFQQEQVKINNLNTSFQEEQTKLNTLSTDFQAYQADLNLKQQEWNLGAQRSLTALNDIAAVQKEVNDNNTAFQDFQLGVNEDRVKWEQGATLAISHLTDFSAKQTKWNAAVDRSIATQKTVNDNFKIWSDGATAAIQANTDVATALARINGIQVGGRNYFLNSGGVGAPVTIHSNSGSVYPTTQGEDEHGAWLQGAYADGSGWILSTYINPLFESGYGTHYSPDFRSTRVPYTQSVEVMCMEPVQVSLGSRGERFVLEPGVWTRIYDVVTKDTNVRPTGINATPLGDIPESTRLYHRRWKLEAGNRVTDWTPAIEDLPTQAQVDEAQNTALEAHDLLFEKQDEWNDGTIAALDAQKKVNDNFKKWSDGATTAIEANTTAIKALSKIDTGESLIAYLTPTDAEVKAGTAKYDVPVWTTGAHRKFSGQNPPPEHVKYAFGAASNEGTTSARKVPVAVRPGTKYILSFWAYGSGKIVIYLQGNGAGNPVRSNRQLMVDQDTLQVLKDSEGRRRYNPAENGNSSNANGTQWLLNGFKPDQLYKWVHYKFEVEFTESTTEVWFQNFYWNWTEASVYGQYLADMQFYPDVPTQADVDSAQNKAIESLSILAAKQDEWSDGAQKAINANRDVATALARINGIQVGGRNLLKKSDLNVSNGTDNVARAYFGDSVPEDGEEITISIKGSLGEGKTSFGFYNSGGNTYVTGAYPSEQDSNGVIKVVTKWKSNSSNSYLNIYAMPGSVSATSTVEWVKLERGNQATDWTPAPEDLPTQKQVDDAQNDAIEANTEALKALGMKSLGTSLVPYKTPSTQEVKDYAAGKLDYDPWAEPEYMNAGNYIGNTSKGRSPGSQNRATNPFEGTPVKVDPKIGYRVKFETYASDAGSVLYWYMYNQNNENCLSFTPFADSPRAGGLIHGLTIPKGWKTWEGVISFKPETTEAKLWSLFWNHSSGVMTTQYIRDLEIIPDIPDANVVNELQDNAIRKNTEVGAENQTAIKALTDGLNAAIELGSANDEIEALRSQLSEEEKKRSEMQAEIDALQTEMIPRTIVSDDRVTYDDYVSISGTTVTAKPGWAGQMAITYTNRSGYSSSSSDYVYRTQVTRKSVPDGTTRSWKLGYEVHRVDYWVYQGKPRTISLRNAGPYITGSSFASTTWGVLDSHTVGKTYGTAKVEWRANLLYADRGVTYRFKIEVNGEVVKNVSWNGIGPLTPLGSGKATLRFEHEFDLPDDATVRILGYAFNSTSQQARVSLLQGTLSYVQDTAREAK